MKIPALLASLILATPALAQAPEAPPQANPMQLQQEQQARVLGFPGLQQKLIAAETEASVWHGLSDQQTESIKQLNAKVAELQAKIDAAAKDAAAKKEQAAKDAAPKKDEPAPLDKK